MPGYAKPPGFNSNNISITPTGNISSTVLQDGIEELQDNIEELDSDFNVGLAGKSDYALPVNSQSGTTYTFSLANATQLTTASNASAKTFTIPPQIDVAWRANEIIRVVNYGAGALTVNGGSGVTVTNTAATVAQYASAAAIRTAENAWTLVPFAGGGVGNADFSNTATGTYTDSGVNYKYIRFTSSGTLTVTTAGYADVLLVGGGGNGSTGIENVRVGSGGAGGIVRQGNVFLSVGSQTVTVGGGGSGRSQFAKIFVTDGGGGAGSSSGGSNIDFTGAGTQGGQAGSGGASSNANGSGQTGGTGVASSITGTLDYYGSGGGGAPSWGGVNGPGTYGRGGQGTQNAAAGVQVGNAGAVIIRVKV